MKRFRIYLSVWLLMVILFAAFIFQASNASAQDDSPDIEDVVQGARLFDDWTVSAAAGETPLGDHPMWSRQTLNTQSGVDTWRCVTCHGWDYQGKDGAFRSGAYATGFEGVMNASVMDTTTLVGVLSGEEDPQHDFSPYLSPVELEQLAKFIQFGVIDDNQFINSVSRKVETGDLANGKNKYETSCQSCHGADGTALTFRYEGNQISLGTLAVQDPWRFLHRTRFGTARAPEMTIGAEIGWSAVDGRDVLYYVQNNFPSGFEAAKSTPAVIEEVENQGGPAQSWFTGILTALGAMVTSLGFAVLVGAALIGIILLLVWLLRSRKS